MKKNKFIAFSSLLAIIFVLLGCSNNNQSKNLEYVIGAYYKSSSSNLPDPMYVTHIFYAFGYVNSEYTGINVEAPDKLKQILNLKIINPKLKVLLSLGGETKSAGFSEVAANPILRDKFIEVCDNYCEENGLDGIDLDWEFPELSENDNYIEMARAFRQKFGKKRLLTMASRKNAKSCAIEKSYIFFDFINVMSYDMGIPPYYNAPLYSTDSSQLSVSASIKAHLDKGVPSDKLVIGVPFYGYSRLNSGLQKVVPYRHLNRYSKVMHRVWDVEAKVPYLADSTGQMMISYDDAESIKYKSEFAVDNNLLGIMYWQFGQDDDNQTLTKVVYETFLKAKKIY